MTTDEPYTVRVWFSQLGRGERTVEVNDETRPILRMLHKDHGVFQCHRNADTEILLKNVARKGRG